MVVGSLVTEADLAVIGAGTGGYVAAIRAAQLGKSVVLIEKSGEVGGVCLHHGCIPTKALVHATDFAFAIQHLQEMGIEVKEHTVNFEKMREWKNSISSKLDKGIRFLLKHHGVELINGIASFRSSNELHIEGKSDVNTVVFKNAVIATGSSPVEIKEFPFSHPRILSSKEALSLETIPKKLVIIGGGYIGTEMGTVYGKLGAEVHVVEMLDRILPAIDRELAEVVAKRLSNFNIQLHLSSKAKGFEETESGIRVNIDENGQPKAIEADYALVVVGRRPNTEGLGLENTSVTLDEKGFIVVDETMRTTDKNIFAVGDVAGQPMLAHKSFREGKVAAEVACGKKSAFDNRTVPFAVFNDPEIASAGLTEEEAAKKGLKTKTAKFPFSALGRAQTLNETEGFVKIVAEEESNLVLGVHVVGPRASDIIGEAALAIEMGATLEDIAATIHPHPTLPESLMEAAELAMGKAIHFFKR